MKPEDEDEAIEQETFIVRAWLAEQGADALRHHLLKFLDDEGGITYVLADASAVAPFIRDGAFLETVEAAKSRWPYLYVKPDFDAPERARLPA